nr:threonine/serine exporter family protein [Kutzneria albida]
MPRQPLTSEDSPVLGPELPPDSTVNLVLDLALRIGEVQLASGAAAADVTATLLTVTEACGLPHCEVDVIFTSISVCCHRGTAASPVTSMRVVRSRGLDYTRLAAVERLVRELGAGTLTPESAATELDLITKAPHPYPRWVATAAWAGMAASVALLLGGNAVLALFAALVTAVVDRIGRLLNRRKLPFFYQQVVGGAVACGAALVVTASDLVPVGQMALVVAAGIVVLLSGLSVVSSVQDAITGYNVTASGRAMETLLMTAGLIAGVVLALRIGVQLGVNATLVQSAPLAFSAVPIQVVTGATACACYALASYAQPRALPVAGLAGAGGVGCYAVLQASGIDMITATALAAVLIGFGGALMSRRLGIAPLIVVVSGMTPLLPGLTTYRGLYQLIVQGDMTGLSTLVVALGIGLALAAGVVLGEFLAQPVRSGLGRLERRFSWQRRDRYH